jgi:glycosyltransferase involved in cell wall biosynthesis
MPTLALSMIVKNAERDLRECLESVRGAVSEIVIADTGSTDSSIAIARDAGARVISIAWNDDFAKARNLSLDEVRSDWVLILDADERLDPAAIKALPELMTEPGIAGYQITIRNYLPDTHRNIWDRPSKPNDGRFSPARQYPAYVDHENIRLFPRHPDIYFIGRVHETVGWRIRNTHGKIGAANFYIHHFGLTCDKETLARKVAFYRNLGRLKLADMPDNAQAHFEAGIVELEDLDRPIEALPYLQHACELNPKFGVAWFFLAKAQFRVGKYWEVLRSLREAESAGYIAAAAAELAGDVNYILEHYDDAAVSYSWALRRTGGSAALETKVNLAKSRADKVTSDPRGLREAHVETAP